MPYACLARSLLEGVVTSQDGFPFITAAISALIAYADFHGAEAGSRQLDYIWMSNGCRVLESPTLDVGTERRSASETSGHLMVEAVIQLPVQLREREFLSFFFFRL